MENSILTESADIVVIGAGISGIGATEHLKRDLPGKSVLLLEARDSIGGTWDLFRYPGIRSDSDLHTYGYEFKPWRHRSAIAEGSLISDYLAETITEFGLDTILRLGHRVTSAHWSSTEAKWTLHVTVTDAGGAQTTKIVKAGFVFSATGYYRYDEGYTPRFDGRQDFAGDVLHPQHWPADYDYSGKRVVIIGSGATAVTMVPAMLQGDRAAAHVTMLQRTPSYIASLPRVDKIALTLTKVFGVRGGYAATRFKNIWQDYVFVTLFSKYPDFGRKQLRKWMLKELPDGFDVDTHFNPPYDPWDQRLCVTPDGEFFTALREGSADVVTDHVERFTRDGILLRSGRRLDADLIVTATGMVMQMLGGIEPTVDGVPVRPSDSLLYRGALISGVPNWAMMLGYTKASWTLRLSNVCRLAADVIRHMDTNGYDTAVPVVPDGMPTQDLLDLSAGYMQRAKADLPRQGAALPWQMRTTFVQDNKLFKGPLLHRDIHFSSRAPRSAHHTQVGAES